MNRKRGVVLNNRGQFFWKNRGRQFFIKNRRGQIWVETVIYTLIAFAMIGLVLTFVKPRIEEIRDRGVIEQSIAILQDIKSVIKDPLMMVPGNQRIVELGINKGTLIIDGAEETISFEIESKVAYSQEGRDVDVGGGVISLTEKKGGLNIVTLSTEYGDLYNLKYEGRDESKSLSKAPTPYKLIFLNVGEDDLNKTIIDIRLGN